MNEGANHFIVRGKLDGFGLRYFQCYSKAHKTQNISDFVFFSRSPSGMNETLKMKIGDQNLQGDLDINGNAFITYHDKEFSAIAKHFVDANKKTRTIHFNAGKYSDENQIREIFYLFQSSIDSAIPNLNM